MLRVELKTTRSDMSLARFALRKQCIDLAQDPFIGKVL